MSTHDSGVVAEAAARLRTAWETRTPTAPVRTLLQPGDLAAAYAIQKTNVEARLNAGERAVGRKIGLTAKAVQQQLGVDQPDYGVLFDGDVFREDQVIVARDAMQPRAEAEVALVLCADLAMPRPSVADVIRATAYALPAIEIVGSRIAGWDINIQDTIADNASAQLIVLGGHPVPIDRLDLELCGMRMSVNGQTASIGIGAACLGNPLNAAAWLAAKMVEVGMPLKAGDIVMTGALGPMVAMKPGDAVEVRIAGLGMVGCRFA